MGLEMSDNLSAAATVLDEVEADISANGEITDDSSNLDDVQ